MLPADAAEPERDAARVRPPVTVDLLAAAAPGAGAAGRDGRHDVEDGTADHDRPPLPWPI